MSLSCSWSCIECIYPAVGECLVIVKSSQVKSSLFVFWFALCLINLHLDSHYARLQWTAHYNFIQVHIWSHPEEQFLKTTSPARSYAKISKGLRLHKSTFRQMVYKLGNSAPRLLLPSEALCRLRCMKATTVSESRYKTATIAESDTLPQILQITQENWGVIGQIHLQ